MLEYYHLPVEIKAIIIDYYDNYAISVSTDDYTTDRMIVGKGVLQGDCLSPLLFNMIVNTLNTLFMVNQLTIKKFVVCVKVQLRLCYHVTGFNLLMIRLSLHQLEKITNCS